MNAVVPSKPPPLLPLGSFVNRFGWKGKVGAVGWTGGERYYWLVTKDCVSMVPAFMLEDSHK
jgi:hypothetical protein